MTTDLTKVRAALLTALPAGAANELLLAQVDRAAELIVLAGQLRQKALAGRRTDLDRLMRLENLGSRLLRGLGRRAAEGEGDNAVGAAG